jgi:hypothetical protein
VLGAVSFVGGFWASWFGAYFHGSWHVCGSYLCCDISGCFGLRGCSPSVVLLVGDAQCPHVPQERSISRRWAECSPVVPLWLAVCNVPWILVGYGCWVTDDVVPKRPRFLTIEQVAEEVSPPASPATDEVPAKDVPAPVEEKQQPPVPHRPSDVPDWEYRHQKSVVLYEALTARVGHRDGLLWQPPALAMTAQAFLLTIALGHESRPIARFIAACLGLGVTFLSIQLMQKHNLHMTNDMVTMRAMERQMKMPTSVIHYDDQVRYVRAEHEDLSSWLREKKGITRFASVKVWIWGLGFFGLMNLLLLVFAGLDMFGVPCADWLGGDSKCFVRL